MDKMAYRLGFKDKTFLFVQIGRPVRYNTVWEQFIHNNEYLTILDDKVPTKDVVELIEVGMLPESTFPELTIEGQVIEISR